ncbi:MAG: hypothetical protein RI910_1534 [Verrucomicrobiota bacterium]|jgi:hypothetical protein
MKPHVHTCVYACEPSGRQSPGAAAMSSVLRLASCARLNRRSMSFYGLPCDRALAAKPGGFNDACHGGRASAEKVVSPNVLQRVGDLAEGVIP